MLRVVSLFLAFACGAMASTILIDSTGSPQTDFAVGGATGYGMQFTATSLLPAPNSLLEISAPFDIGGTFTAYAEILSDSGGTPGTVLVSSAPVTTTANGVVTLNFMIPTTGSVFAANTSYWIGLMFDPSQPGNLQLIENPPTVTSGLGWTLNTGTIDGETGGTWGSVVSCGGSCTGLVFDVTATTVPEIPTVFCGAIAVLLPFARRRFRKQPARL